MIFGRLPACAARLPVLAALGSAVVVLAASPVSAQSAEGARTEARERFDRGLRLFNQGDAAGALAEFRLAHERAPHPLVLFNIALVYELLARPVEAVDAAARVLAEPGDLSADRLARIKTLHAEQATRIGTVDVQVAVAGASIELDGEVVGTAPLAEPLRVATGSHLLGIVAAGHAPVRRTILVASRAHQVEKVTLEPLTGRLAHLTLTTTVPDAEVVVDGQRVGLAPLQASLALVPGRHTIELRRAGYRSVSKSIELGDGSVGTVALDPEVAPEKLVSDGGTLALTISEPDSVLFLDGVPRGAYGTPLRLPAGRHRLRVERSGFFPFERDVDVPKGASAAVPIELQPTPEWRADYVSSARSRRTWGYIAGGVGAVLAVGGGTFLVVNAGQKSKKEEAFDAILFESEAGSGRRCDPMGTAAPSCPVEREIALEELDDARSRDVFGWVGVGVGAAALGLGLTLVLTGEDPDRYEPRPESDVFGRVELLPYGFPGTATTGVQARVTF